MLDYTLTRKQFFYLEILVILGFSFFPVFFNLPFRDNLYLSWEGAYRLYLGQVPYKDFGMPLGFGYFLIPAFFFKIFGPYLYSLLYAQIFINLVSLFTFRAILKTFGVDSVKLFLSVLIFCLSYSFIYFWPWYNNTAFFYEMIAIWFTLLFIFKGTGKKAFLFIFLASLFTFLAFFTKQDYGGIAFLFCLFLFIANSLIEKKSIKYIPVYLGFTGLVAFLFIFPFLKYDFGYWFNFGQPPHQSRLHLFNFFDEILGGSYWEKFYLLIIAVVVFIEIKDFKKFIKNKQTVFFVLVTIGIILQALITKVTSRLPTDTTTYFHAFAFAFIISAVNIRANLEKAVPFIVTFFMIMFWWSGMYWKYANRFFKSSMVKSKSNSKNFKSQDTWKLSGLKSFDRVYLPPSTIEGIKNILNQESLKQKMNLRVLNMSELTPLAYEMNYIPEVNLPLWYHLNVGMFEREVQVINDRIKNNDFDLVLFEVIPNLDNFYPEETRKVLQQYYRLSDSFPAPRKDSNSFIEVYFKK